MGSSNSEGTLLDAQLKRPGNGLADLHAQVVATHQDVRALIEIALRCDRRANELLAGIKEATARLRQFHGNRA